MNGNWTQKQPENLDANPAGIRIPKEFKKSLADKIPNLIEKLKKEGKDESSIQDMIEQKKINQVEKYGNKSKVGLILDMKNN